MKDSFDFLYISVFSKISTISIHFDSRKNPTVVLEIINRTYFPVFVGCLAVGFKLVGKVECNVQCIEVNILIQV